jgi:hypothetical protein
MGGDESGDVRRLVGGERRRERSYLEGDERLRHHGLNINNTDKSVNNDIIPVSLNQ